MDSILEYAKKRVKPDNIEVYKETSRGVEVQFENGELKTVKSHSVTGYSLRVIFEGRMGFSCGTSPHPRGLTEKALASSRFGYEADFSFPRYYRFSSVNGIFDENIENMTVEETVDKGREILEILREKVGDFQFDVSISRRSLDFRLLSNRRDIGYKKTFYNFSVNAQKFQEGDFLLIGEEFSSPTYKPEEKKIAEKILKTLANCRKTAIIVPETMPVLLTPSAFCELIKSFFIGINGKSVEKGASPLRDKMNKRIFPHNITIYDDSITPSIGTVPFDGEGVRSKKKVLVEKGILKNFVLDMKTANALKMKTTGNARRGYDAPPSPGVHAGIFNAGNISLEELKKSISTGILIEQLMGGHTGNPYSGDFQMNVSVGFLLNRGEILGRVKNIMITGNLYQLFSSLMGISKEREWVGRYYLPHIAFEKMKVV